MLTVRRMLEQLRGWLETHRAQIQEYIEDYPYVQYKLMEVASTFKNTVSAIVQHIANIVTSNRLQLRQDHRLTRAGGVSPQVVNSFYNIKAILDRIKYVFLGADDIKTLNAYILLKKIDDALVLTIVRLPSA